MLAAPRTATLKDIVQKTFDTPTGPVGLTDSPMNLSVEQKPLRELVAEKLRDLILNGQLTAGTALRESRVAAEFGVSRNPVREAIRSLEAAGLVDVHPRKGAVVSSFSQQDLHQIFELRLLLQDHVGRLAARNASDDEIKALQACVDAGAEATDASSFVAASAYHREFHERLELASGNRWISVALQPLQSRTEMVFSTVLTHRQRFTWREHQAIVDAIRNRDEDGAAEAIKSHIRQAVDEYDAIQARGGSETEVGESD